MSQPAMVIAMGDQLHAEITARGNREAKAMFDAEGLPLSEDDQMHVEIGVQAGLHAALRTLADKGWLRVEVQS